MAVPVTFFHDPQTALYVATAAIAIQQVEGNLVYPFVMSGAAELHPFVTLLALLLFGALFDFLGDRRALRRPLGPLAPGGRGGARGAPLRLAGRARYGRLLEAGVRIYEWLPSTLHAKTLVVDGRRSAVGTMNFDNRSLAFNEEVMIMVLDRDFGARLDALFLDDLRHAEEIHLARFRRRPRPERLAERAASRVARLL